MNKINKNSTISVYNHLVNAISMQDQTVEQSMGEQDFNTA